MWKEKSEERLERYKNILKGSPLLYEAACEAKALASNGADNHAANGQEVQIAGEAALAADRARQTEPESRGLQSEAAENVSYYCLAPALCSYVCWVLKQASEAGIKRLYFLARDAYFMYEAAKILCSAFNLQIECRYLSCSRYSIRIPMYRLDMDGALGYICRGGIDVTMEKILNRAGLSPKEQEDVLEDLRENGSFAYGSESLVPYAELENIKQALKGSSIFMESVIRHSEAAMPLLEGYLKQEGLLDDIPMAFVDSGWVGSMQKTLNDAVYYIKAGSGCAENVRAIEGYYWGLYEMPENVEPKNYHCYYFAPGYNIEEKIYFSNCLFEAVFSAPHGMTMGYKEENGTYFPVYGEITDAQRAFMKENEVRFKSFARCYAERACEGIKGDDIEIPAPEQDKKTVYRLLRCFMGEPCISEAEIFGRLHFSDDVLDYKSQELAADLSPKELTANHAFHKILSMLGIKKGFLRESAWYEASAVLGGKSVKRHLRGYAGYKRLLYMRKQRSWRKMYG